MNLYLFSASFLWEDYGVEVLAKFEEQRQVYWRLREELLKKYRGKWIAVCDGAVAAVGETKGEVIKAAYRRCGFKPMYVSKVGEEKKVSRRVYRNQGMV